METHLTNKDIIIPYYSGNIKFTKCIGHVSLERFIYAHKSPNARTKQIIEQVKVASSNKDLALKRALKHKLYSFTPSAFFKLGVNRKYANLERFNPIMSMDFDGIENVAKARDLKEYLFTTYQCVICAYVSPSERGVKALIRIKQPTDIEHFRAMHRAVEAEFEQIGYFDVATKNAILPLFLSIDENIYSRDFSECFPWTDELEPPKRINHAPPNLNFSPTSRYNNQADYYLDKTIALFRKKIINIVDNGHPQLRTACLVLGSRVGAGYISLAEAEQLAKYEASVNGYLNQNLSGYNATIEWAIKEGMKSPKEY
jgi:VirE N-terminal domain